MRHQHQDGCPRSLAFGDLGNLESQSSPVYFAGTSGAQSFARCLREGWETSAPSQPRHPFPGAVGSRRAFRRSLRSNGPLRGSFGSLVRCANDPPKNPPCGVRLAPRPSAAPQSERRDWPSRHQRFRRTRKGIGRPQFRNHHCSVILRTRAPGAPSTTEVGVGSAGRRICFSGRITNSKMGAPGPSHLGTWETLNLNQPLSTSHNFWVPHPSRVVCARVGNRSRIPASVTLLGRWITPRLARSRIPAAEAFRFSCARAVTLR